MKKYLPFTFVTQVEEYFNHSIYKDGIKYTVVGANYVDNKLHIQAVDNSGNELSMPATMWFNCATFMEHSFGAEIK